MAKIDLAQLDDFTPTFNVDVKEGDIAVWSESEEAFIPLPEFQLRRIFMLMGA
jgi:hypothetical protein